jgi:hypothetical protein
MIRVFVKIAGAKLLLSSEKAPKGKWFLRQFYQLLHSKQPFFRSDKAKNA